MLPVLQIGPAAVQTAGASAPCGRLDRQPVGRAPGAAPRAAGRRCRASDPGGARLRGCRCPARVRCQVPGCLPESAGGSHRPDAVHAGTRRGCCGGAGRGVGLRSAQAAAAVADARRAGARLRRLRRLPGARPPGVGRGVRRAGGRPLGHRTVGRPPSSDASLRAARFRGDLPSTPAPPARPAFPRLRLRCPPGADGGRPAW